MSITIAPLFSGSSGNSIFIKTDKTKILIDAGKTCKKIETELAKIGESIADLDGILVTHEHSDHIKGLEIITKKYDVPVYASCGTWQCMAEKLTAIKDCNIREITTEDFYINDICVQPFDISHDAAQPFGYALDDGEKKISVLTDLGRCTKSIVDTVGDSSIVLLEANHDVDMLSAGKYPYYLKRRILSASGHLSNEACAEVAVALARNGVRGILLGHLSINNNAPSLAYQTVVGRLLSEGIETGKHIAVAVAKREEYTGVFKAK